eukprot:15355087-Ditylum_brightwellii.AAC.1
MIVVLVWQGVMVPTMRQVITDNTIVVAHQMDQKNSKEEEWGQPTQVQKRESQKIKDVSFPCSSNCVNFHKTHMCKISSYHADNGVEAEFVHLNEKVFGRKGNKNGER